MQACDELKYLVVHNYTKEAKGEIREVVTNSYSQREEPTLVGSDPEEWFEGYDAIYRFYEPGFTSKLVVQVEELKAYCEGSVGWTIDRVRVKFAGGMELPMSHTRIFHKEEDGWKIVHNHISILIPNEKLAVLSSASID